MNLRAGRWLVGVRCDTAATAERIETVFNERRADHRRELPAAFSVRDAHRHGRNRHQAMLERGNTIFAKATELTPLLDVLRGHLEGLDRDQDPVASATQRALAADAINVPLRLFTSEQRAVLVNVAQPTLVDDRWLAERGIVERHCWQPEVNATTRRVVWPAEFDVAGIITVTPGATAVADLWSLAAHHRNNWLMWLNELDAAERILTVDDKPVAARRAIAELLDRP